MNNYEKPEITHLCPNCRALSTLKRKLTDSEFWTLAKCKCLNSGMFKWKSPKKTWNFKPLDSEHGK